MDYFVQSNSIGIRKMQDDLKDYKLMAKWLSTEEVLEYYEGRDNVFDIEKVIEKFEPRAKGEDTVTPCLIEVNGTPIGYIQYYLIDPEEYKVSECAAIKDYEKSYGIDLFIGEVNSWSKGIGTIALSSLIKYLFQCENADTIFIDPRCENKRAIRCYEKCGFNPRCVVKNRELFNGRYRDSLIMSISFKEWKNKCISS